MKPVNMAPRRYLVTGGCGFIGSHLVSALIDRGHEVMILDDLSTGKRENTHPQASLLVGSTTDYATVADALKDRDGCFHLAAVASVEKSTRDWVNAHRVNITSTINIFQAVSRMQKKIPVVYTSSAAVYGDCPAMPISENIPPQPLTAYGADKLACDLHGRIAWQVHGIPTMGLRPFNVYGPGQDPSSPYSGVISIFMDRIRQSLPITIYGDGRQVRDFIYVEDAVKAFMAAMDGLQEQRHHAHTVVNLCTGRPTSINHLAGTLARLMKTTPRVSYVPARQGDIRLSIGNPAWLKACLKVEFDTTLDQGLCKTLSTFSVPAPAVEFAA